MEKTIAKPRAARKPSGIVEKQTDRESGITDALRAAMKDSGQSAYRLAADSGVNVAVILRFMSGERGLTLHTVDRLAALLGLELTQRKGK